jgi:hypothetical protein
MGFIAWMRVCTCRECRPVARMCPELFCAVLWIFDLNGARCCRLESSESRNRIPGTVQVPVLDLPASAQDNMYLRTRFPPLLAGWMPFLGQRLAITHLCTQAHENHKAVSDCGVSFVPARRSDAFSRETSSRISPPAFCRSCQSIAFTWKHSELFTVYRSSRGFSGPMLIPELEPYQASAHRISWNFTRSDAPTEH